MAYTDLREFIRALEKEGELKRVAVEADPVLEITEFADRVQATTTARSLTARGFQPLIVSR